MSRRDRCRAASLDFEFAVIAAGLFGLAILVLFLGAIGAIGGA